jgi:hypothetical protein
MATISLPFPRKNGLPRKQVDAARIAVLRAQGASWPQIAAQLGVSVCKVYTASRGF